MAHYINFETKMQACGKEADAMIKNLKEENAQLSAQKKELEKGKRHLERKLLLSNFSLQIFSLQINFNSKSY
jgi:hypothetical protein